MLQLAVPVEVRLAVDDGVGDADWDAPLLQLAVPVEVISCHLRYCLASVSSRWNSVGATLVYTCAPVRWGW